MKRRPIAMAVVMLLFAVGLRSSMAEAASHCLWRVSNATNHIYLQGSVHLLKPSHYPLPSEIEDAYADSDLLVLEADLAASEDPALQMALLKQGMLEGKTTLHDLLSASTWAMAEKQLSGMGMNIALFNGFKPWYFAMTITAMRLQSMGFSAFDGLDWHFYRRAKEDRKPVVGLETLAYQMRLFDAISQSDQDALVRQTLEDIVTIETEMDQILEGWATGDLKTMDEALLKSFKKYPHIYKALVVDRNHNWVPRLIGFLESGKVHMVIVGAGHFGGREGLLHLLQARGLTLEQL